jgi:hypothetical protein
VLFAGLVWDGCAGSGASTNGITVDLRLVSTASTTQGSVAGGGQRLLGTGWVTVSQVTLVRCAGQAWRWERVLSPLTVAWAHGESSPLAVAVPHVLDVMAARQLEAGTFSPAPGRYCQVRVTFSPADADANGLAQADAMMGRVLRLTGSQDGAPFEAVASQEHTVALELRNAAGDVEALTVDAARNHAVVQVTLPDVFPLLGSSLLDGVAVLHHIAGACTAKVLP